MVRQIFVFIHRWAGLLMTVFLILVGLTGSVIAFMTRAGASDQPAALRAPKGRCGAARSRDASRARRDSGPGKPG